MNKSAFQNPTVRVGIQSPGWPHEDFPNGITKYVAHVSSEIEALGTPVTILANKVVDEKLASVNLVNLKFRDADRSLAARITKKISQRLYRQSRIKNQLEKFVKTDKFRCLDLIQMTDSFGHARILKKMIKIPLVVRLHGPWFLVGTELGVKKDRSYWERVHNEGEGIKCADFVTAPSAEVLDQVRQYYDIPLLNAEVIPNPVNGIKKSEAWNLDECEKHTLLFVGRFDRIKGGDLLLDSFVNLKRKYSDLKLILVGPDRGLMNETGENVKLKEYISRKHLDKEFELSINWKGELPYGKILPLRRQAMLTIVSSRYETFGNVVLEALSCGSPCVASDSGGIPEIICNGDTGLLFKSGDVNDLTKKISKLLDCPAYAREIGMNAMRDIENRFSGSKIAQKHIDLYKRVISQFNAQT